MPPELHQLQPGQNFEFSAPGFDRLTYGIGVLANTLTIRVPDKKPERLPAPIEIDQHAVLRFLATNVGQNFRAADVYHMFDTPDRAPDRYNEAVLDKKTGLYIFVSKVTGSNLWWRDGKDNRFGDGDEEEVQSTDTVQQEVDEYRLVRSEFDFTDAEAKLMEALAAINPDERTPADQLFELLGERLKQSSRIIEGTLRGIISKTTARARGVAVMGIYKKGKGRHAAQTVWIDPLLFAPPAAAAASKEGTQPLPAVVTPDAAAPTRTTSTPNRGLPKQVAAGNRATTILTSITLEQVGLLPDPPETAWILNDQGLFVEGQRLPLEANCVDLLKCLAFNRRTTATMSTLASLFSARRLSAGQEPIPFTKFVPWANLVVDFVNLYAPVVAINNVGRNSRRDNRTRYNINKGSLWGALRQHTAGYSFNDPCNPQHVDSILARTPTSTR